MLAFFFKLIYSFFDKDCVQQDSRSERTLVSFFSDVSPSQPEDDIPDKDGTLGKVADG